VAVLDGPVAALGRDDVRGAAVGVERVAHLSMCRGQASGFGLGWGCRAVRSPTGMQSESVALLELVFQLKFRME
jgi:hypothetical protein